LCLLWTASTYFCSYSLFSNATATSEIYSLSLHDALPISGFNSLKIAQSGTQTSTDGSNITIAHSLGYEAAFLSYVKWDGYAGYRDRKSTRLNSSHVKISYAVFCLKKKII